MEGEVPRESFTAEKKHDGAGRGNLPHSRGTGAKDISSDDGGNAVIEQFKRYAGITELTREISIELLQSVTIYPDGRMDIRLNIADEIKSLMGKLAYKIDNVHCR